MNEELYIDTLKRIMGLAESVAELSVSVSALGAILAANDDLVRMTKVVRETDSIQRLFKHIEDRNSEINQLEKEMNIAFNKLMKEKNNDSST